MAALSCGQPDRVPLAELYINESILVRIAEALQPDEVHVEGMKSRFGEERREILDAYCMVVEELGLDATCSNISTGLNIVGDDLAQDKFGTKHKLSDFGEPLPCEGPIKTKADLKGFDMVSRLERKDLSKVSYMIDKMGGERASMVSVTDPFKLSWQRRGALEHLLMDYAEDPEMAHALARIATDYVKAAIDIALEMGADAFVMPGDVAGELNLMMSPTHFREYIKPYHREIVEHVHKGGSKIVKHSDGNMWPVMDDLIEVGFDGFHPVQPQCMDIGEVKQRLAGTMCVLGNIDCRNLLVFGTPEEVEQVVKETIEKAAPGGGYVLTSSNSIHPACKPENYIAMVRAAHKYGVYDG
jgi:uroporphyrinogen decarboxylase